jgi:hypothetical protein
MLERVAESFLSEKEFWSIDGEDYIEFIEAYLYYDKDVEIYYENKFNKFQESLKKEKIKNDLEYDGLKFLISNNFNIKFIPKK